MSTAVKTAKGNSKPKADDDFIPRPDRTKFLEQVKAYRAELDQLKVKLNKQKQTIGENVQGANQTPEETSLRDEHSGLLAERNRLRDLEKRINDEAKRIEDSVKSKVAELQSLKPKSGPKSVQELDQLISKLEGQVDRGEFTIAQETRTIKEISALKKQRVAFSQADKLQAEIDEARQRAAAKKKSFDQAALRQVLARKAELEKKLDTFKDSREARRKQLNGAHDIRRQLHSEIKELTSKIDSCRKKFDEDMADFEAKMKAKKQQREIEEAENKLLRVKQKKIADAEAKVAAAREPAYANHIEKAERLLVYFDPTLATSSKAATPPSPTGSTLGSISNSKSSVSKAINAPTATGQAIQHSAPSVPPSRKSLKSKNKSSTTPQPLNMDFNIIDALASLKITPPTTSSDIETTKKQLREKIAFYVENNDRVTKERTERAEEDLKKVLEEVEAESATSQPASA